MLTSSEIEQYHHDGFVTPDFRLDETTLDDIREAHARLVNRHPEFSDYCSAVLAYDTWFLTVARRPEILDMVEQVIGSDIALWNSSFFAKPAKVGTRTPWHQDGEYWPIEPLATCTVWIAIDASTTKNGCLRVIPGSHKSKRLARHNRSEAPNIALIWSWMKPSLTNQKPSTLSCNPVKFHFTTCISSMDPNPTSLIIPAVA